MSLANETLMKEVIAMANPTIVKMEYNVPNPENPCSHSMSCVVVVEGVTSDEALRETVEIVCAALRRNILISGDEEHESCDGDDDSPFDEGGQPVEACSEVDDGQDQRGATAGSGDVMSDQSDTGAVSADIPDSASQQQTSSALPYRHTPQSLSIVTPDGATFSLPENYVVCAPKSLFVPSEYF